MQDQEKDKKIEKSNNWEHFGEKSAGREVYKVEKTEKDIEQEKIISEELRRELDLMQLDESLKDEVQKKAQSIVSLSQKEKIKRLLQEAEEKGVIFAVKTAESMNDPYLLDMLHDILAKEGYYEKFKK